MNPRCLPLLIVPLLTAISWRASSQISTKPSLFARSVRCAAIPGLKQKNWNAAYDWVSERKVLVGIDNWEAFRGFCMLNLKTKLCRAVPGLNRIANKWRRIEWSVSPNGRRILIHSRDFAVLARLDGTGARGVPGGHYHSENFWLDDSRRWLHTWAGSNGNLLDYEELRIYCQGMRGKGVRLENSATNPLSPPKTVAVASSAGTLYTCSHCRPNGVSGLEENTGYLAILSRPLARPRSRSRKGIIRLPEEVRIEEVAFSRDCRRLAILVTRPHGKPACSLWVCRTDGTGLAVIGNVLGEYRYEPEDWRPQKIAWTPSDDGISFLYRKALYVVQVGRGRAVSSPKSAAGRP